MTSSNPPDPYDHPGWTQRRQQVHDRLAEQAAPLASLYASAVFLLHQPSWPGRQFLLGHSVREIGQRLPDFLDPRQRPRAETDRTLEAFAAAWSSAGLPTTGVDLAMSSLKENDVSTPATAGTSSTDDGLLIPIDVAQAGAELVEAYKQGGANNYDKAASIILASSIPDATPPLREVATEGEGDPTVMLWTKTVDWFMKSTHVGIKERAAPPEEELVHRFEIIEDMIEAILASWYQVLDDLDEALAAANAQPASHPDAGRLAGKPQTASPSSTDQDVLPGSKGEPT
jgi:hypothetical protein